MTRPVRAWHFLPEDRRLTNGDGRVVRTGEAYLYTGDKPIELCERGMHASVRAIDALKHAPGPVICRVECGGGVIHGGDKLVCMSRRVLWMADATETLRHFARLCALDVIHLWDAPDVVVRYLRTGREDLRAAARAATCAAARVATWDATWDATRGAARDAASDAAWASGRAAAWHAAWAVVGGAARAAQSRRLHRMLMALGRQQ